MLKQLARWSFTHRRLMVLGWIVLLVGSAVLASAVGGTSRMDFKLPKSDSQAAQDLLVKRFHSQSGAHAQVVFAVDHGTVDAPAVRPQVENVLQTLDGLPHVTPITSPFDPSVNRRQISSDGTVAFAEINFDVDFSQLHGSVADQVSSVATHATKAGLHVDLSGDIFEAHRPPGGTESIGVLAAIVILLLAFGSLLAMGLPIMVALFGIGIGLAFVTLLSNVFSMPSFASQLAAMIGIGVGIDYALFIVTRYRQDLHQGMSPEASVIQSISTSGKAVLFAGCTVVISLLGMFAMGISFVRGLAVGAALAVVVTMVASVTLLPAVLGFVGTGIDKFGFPWTKRANEGSHRGVWYRWSRVVQRRPWPSALLGLVVLVALAIPVFSIRLGNTDASNLPTSDTTRRAYDALARGFGPGFNGPLLLAIEVPNPAAASALPHIQSAVSQTRGVVAVTPAHLGPAGDSAVMQVFPSTGPEDQATVSLIHRLRTRVLPPVVAGTGLVVHVGGETAAFQDLSTFLGAHLPIFILAVLGLSFLLLLVVFRSIVVPLKAVVMNVLSIGASYGLLVGVFQWGIGKSVIGIGKTGPLEAFLPMMMFAILFGLSMDYEVFLLSRIKEEWDRTGDNGVAVADGLSYTARVITAAAAIMVCVFGSFMFVDNRVIKEFGLGLAAAIFIDATVVRLLLVPATMELLGNANWWLPRWLDRLIPRVQIESVEELEGLELATIVEEDRLARR